MGTNADKHARQSSNRNRLDQARRQVESEARRRRTMAILGGLLALVVVIVAVVALTGEDDDAQDATGRDAAGEDTTAGGLPEPPEGTTLDEPTECPPEDGADERVQRFAGEPPMCIDPGEEHRATFSTTHGEFTVSLDAASAPATVNNFVVLSRYNYYDGVPFHRVVPGFVVQAGDGEGEPWGNNDVGYSIEDELPDGPEAYTDYSLAMANSGPDTNGSQFFVVLPGGGAQLGPLYSRFGEVTEGQDVIDLIGSLGGPEEEPAEAVVIEDVTITVG